MIAHDDIEQRTPAWFALRVGKPTASEFSKIVTSKGEPSKSASAYALTLAAELFAGKTVDAWEGNSHTERGRELEAAALERYEFTRDVEVRRVGFVTTDDGVTGCSPDGLIGDDGLAEVKALKAENHIKAILYFRKHGRCPTDYVQQTQGQLMICGRAWCDLIFYHPELPMLVIRQEPLRDFHRILDAGVRDVIAERDAVLAVLRDQAAPAVGTLRAAAQSAAPRLPMVPADLSSAAPVF